VHLAEDSHESARIVPTVGCSSPSLIGLLIAYLPAYTERKAICTLDGGSLRWLGVVSVRRG
jgi:hypothetical protein